MPYINTKIVNALLTLRGVSTGQLSRITGISFDAMAHWLNDSAREEDARIPYDRQLEVIKILGIVGDYPRADTIHAWYLTEPAFGDRAAAYEPLRTMLLYCGACEVTLLAPEHEPFATFKAHTYFALTFARFRAVLRVASSPLRTLAFDPGDFPNMRWAGDRAPLILSDDVFSTLIEPGEARPAALDLERHKALEIAHWSKIGLLASERGMGAPELARFLIEHVPTQRAPSSAATLVAEPTSGGNSKPSPESLFRDAR
ncbi:MAG: hypothetical protein RB191_16090 [Terriglobia bacterium]|nr:hypothetical protein [Terriglobia bacterium]